MYTQMPSSRPHGIVLVVNSTYLYNSIGTIQTYTMYTHSHRRVVVTKCPYCTQQRRRRRRRQEQQVAIVIPAQQEQIVALPSGTGAAAAAAAVPPPRNQRRLFNCKTTCSTTPKITNSPSALLLLPLSTSYSIHYYYPSVPSLEQLSMIFLNEKEIRKILIIPGIEN